MRILIGSDHGGLKYKTELIKYLNELGYTVRDAGTNKETSCDYPDYGYIVAKAVSDGLFDRGIVICTTGIGMSIVANKVKKIRCALVSDVRCAKLSREHNNSNVLALGQSMVSLELAKEIVDVWLTTEFSNEKRHQDRVASIDMYGEMND